MFIMKNEVNSVKYPSSWCEILQMKELREFEMTAESMFYLNLVKWLKNTLHFTRAVTDFIADTEHARHLPTSLSSLI